jgi:hypothetical protein
VTDAGLTRAGASAAATTDRARDAAPVPVLVGGVSELFQSDLDLGRLLVEQLQDEGLGGGVFAEELHYGGVAVAQRLEVLRPARLILVSAVARGRPAGTVVRSLLVPPVLDTATVQAAVGDAVTGYVHPDLVVEIACAFGVLPPRTVLVEAEPAVVGPGEGLSPQGQVALEEALRLVRLELGRAPLLALALELQPLVDGDRLEDSVALTALRELLVELEQLDAVGHWGRSFSLRDRFRLGIAHSVSSEGMDHRDWALWWALVEELDRVEAAEAATHT